MKIKISRAKKSKIIEIGSKVKQLEAETGEKYLPLNRGINQVVGVDIIDVVSEIDFRSPQILNYPPTNGLLELRNAINDEYFGGKSTPDNILITAGGMNAIDLVVQSVEMDKLYLPTYYWGCYAHILTIREIGNAEYNSQPQLLDMLDELKGNAVLICDPGNPLGEKQDDDELFVILKTLNDSGVVVLFDCPYRRIFKDFTDTFYQRILSFENVIILESFSKSLGLSGQRLGFIHSSNAELMDELHIRLIYCSNGINAFAQTLVWRLLATEQGQYAVTNFKTATCQGIDLNVNYLKNRGLLSAGFYNGVSTQGMFAVVNRTQDQLLEHRIASVSLSFFTKSRKEFADKYSRVCVSIDHDSFVEYFKNV